MPKNEPGQMRQPAESISAEPRVLPTPRYDYQRPQSGSFVVTYQDKKQVDEKADSMIAGLHNIRLAI
jgi:hypothetical protein